MIVFFCGWVLTYTLDLKWTHIETKAIWWVQIMKAVGGILLIPAAKELLKVPLDALFAGQRTSVNMPVYSG